MFHVEHRHGVIGDGVRSVTLTPDVRTWGACAREHYATVGERARRMRTQLGLPTDRPVVMSGHQPGFWHPGIVAKVFAMDAVCARAGAASAWAVVEHVAGELGRLDVPVRTPAGRLGVERVTVVDVPGDRSWAVVAGRQPGNVRVGGVADEVDAAGLGRCVEAVARCAGAASVALQLTDAMLGLLGSAPAVVGTLSLSRTDLMRGLVAQMREDPGGMRAAFNEAVARRPGAGVAPLAVDAELGVELPLWVIDRRSGAIEPVFERTPIGQDGLVAPRALLMTALMRLGACDLFIHGTGGGDYDLVTEEWVRGWLGEELAPMAVASADVVLAFEAAGVSGADLARARWRAHRARHDPGMLGDDGRGDAKAALVARIEAAPRGSAERREAFDELHRVLAAARAAHAGALAEIEGEVERIGALLGERAVGGRRDWAFFLYPEASMGALRSRITSGFTTAGS